MFLDACTHISEEKKKRKKIKPIIPTYPIFWLCYYNHNIWGEGGKSPIHCPCYMSFQAEGDWEKQTEREELNELSAQI